MSQVIRVALNSERGMSRTSFHVWVVPDINIGIQAQAVNCLRRNKQAYLSIFNLFFVIQIRIKGSICINKWKETYLI